jgi:hypothetical protein
MLQRTDRMRLSCHIHMGKLHGTQEQINVQDACKELVEVQPCMEQRSPGPENEEQNPITTWNPAYAEIFRLRIIC